MLTRRLAPLLIAALLLACSGDDPDAAVDPPDDPADEAAFDPWDDEDDGDDPDGGAGLDGLFGVINPCDEIFVPGRSTAEVLADVESTFMCHIDGEESLIITYTFRCRTDGTLVHYAMAPMPSDYGWGIDEEGALWQSWDARMPKDDCGVTM